MSNSKQLVQCPHCGGMYKNLNVHIRKMHPVSQEQVVVAGQENSSSAPAPRTKFISTRSPGLRVVIRPTRRGFIQTPHGSMDSVFEGKSAQFVNGEFETTDAETIEYLNGVYNDRRYPVVNASKLGVN